MTSIPAFPAVDISDMQGIFLDRAIAARDNYCDGVEWHFLSDHYIGHIRDYDGGYCGNFIICDTKNVPLMAKLLTRYHKTSDSIYSPSTQWKHAGRLIEQADILFTKTGGRYVAHSERLGAFETGDTQLLAICRAWLRHCAVMEVMK